MQQVARTLPLRPEITLVAMADTAHTQAPTGAFTAPALPPFWRSPRSASGPLLHLWDNLSAFGGAHPGSRPSPAPVHPLNEAILVVVVPLPLVLHTIPGIARLASSRPNNVR